MSDLVFHVGYPKTATTLLQTSVFPALEGVDLVPTMAKYEPWARDLVAAHPFDFDPAEARARLAELTGPAPLLVSWEHLLGDAAYGGQDLVERCNRLARIAPSARIVVTIRSQPTLLRSLYRQYVHEGGARSLSSLLQPTVSQAVGFTPGYFDFDRAVSAYEDAFGSERVLVLAYEDIVAPDGDGLDHLCRWLGVDRPAVSLRASNTGLSPFGLAVLRRANVLFASRFSAAAPRRPDRGKTPQRVVHAVLQRVDPAVRRLPVADSTATEAADWLASNHDRFAAGNRRLAERRGLDLEGLGYPT